MNWGAAVALSDDDIIQFDEGSVAATAAVAASLPAGTTAGNAVLVFIQAGGSSLTPASGFTGSFTALGTGFYVKTEVTAGETSWTFTQNNAQDAAWIAVEMANVDPVDPLESTTSTGPTTLSTAGTQSSGTSQPIGLSTVTFALFSLSGNTSAKSWGSYTNGFTEITQIDAPAGTSRPCLALARIYTDGAPVAASSTATATIASGTSPARGRVVVLREAGSPISAPLSMATGFEFGHHGGLAEATVHATGSAQPLGAGSLNGSTIIPTGTWGTNYSIGASYARASDYGLHVTASAATVYVPIASSGSAGSHGQNLRVVSGTGTPTIMTWDVTTGTDLLLVYDVATEKFGLRWGAGSVEYQTGTTPLNTWAWVEVRLKVNATTHRADWWIETGTPDGLQTSPAYLTGMTSTSIAKVVLGGLSSQTVTVDADDVVTSQRYAAFPLGPHKVVRLGVDTGGTATVSGTAANFNVFTANGTLAAFNSANALAALDECPPTVSASADGIVQVSVAASDYVELPMQTYTLAADEVIAGVRMIACMWGGTGTGTGTLSIHGYDGTTDSTVVPLTIHDAGSPTAYSATEPLWMAGTWRATPGSPWTPTLLNNAVLRVGYSNDATPDMGISAIYLEVAIRQAPPFVAHRLTSDEDPDVAAALVTETVHPYSSGVRSYTVSNDDPARTAEFNYSIGGTPQTAVTVGPGGPPEEVTVGAEAFGEVDSTSFGWV